MIIVHLAKPSRAIGLEGIATASRHTLDAFASPVSGTQPIALQPPRDEITDLMAHSPSSQSASAARAGMQRQPIHNGNYLL
jgi:hypothetical protein